ncbi:MAG: hypothetical protein HY698_22620 [Deltaproteobacteria bacterium]|nr:hypothetical protein [Deltaproteobacteria bacterium]
MEFIESKETGDGKVREMAASAREVGRHYAEEAGELIERISTWIRAHPGAALIGALGMGFLVGKVVRR